jgi:DNA-binding MarR family transcriptional regulator/GNAT superfamily N-acetyltransferase
MVERAMVDSVRAFNRAVTQRAGVLVDRYLARGRPLGQARVLWEVGEGGADVRAIRARLGLDSGYLSRLLRLLEGAGLATVAPSPADRRVRTVRLTPKGRRERDLLDRRSDELAASMLEPLGERQRARLVAAMGEVERLLSASSLEFRVVDADDADARACVREYYAELDRRFESGFDPGGSRPVAGGDDDPGSAALFVVASVRGETVGCGALRFHGARPAEVKRMWVSPSMRGLGVGRRLLEELERVAAERGSRAIRLDTNRNLTEAIAMYRSAGYREVAAFNDERYADYWFEKRLAAPAGGATPAGRGPRAGRLAGGGARG